LALCFLLIAIGLGVSYRFVYLPRVQATQTAFAALAISAGATKTAVHKPLNTATQTFTLTPTVIKTPTPLMPSEIAMHFISSVTPDPDTIFDDLIFTAELDSISDTHLFLNPAGTIYAVFTYDQMLEGVQWTVLWYRNGELVHYETMPWNGGSDGFAKSGWALSDDEWLPGNYEVQMFTGMDWKVSGRFTVVGCELTSTLTSSPSPTPTPSMTPSPSPTITRILIYPSSTSTPTRKPKPENTNTPRP
jgi:type VI secretion system secreted protein VgrG